MIEKLVTILYFKSIAGVVSIDEETYAGFLNNLSVKAFGKCLFL